MTHPVVIKTSQLILAGDIHGAESALTEIADSEGDFALVAVLDEVAPKDLLAIMRSFDGSRQSVVNMLVTPARSCSTFRYRSGDRHTPRLLEHRACVRKFSARADAICRRWFPTNDSVLRPDAGRIPRHCHAGEHRGWHKCPVRNARCSCRSGLQRECCLPGCRRLAVPASARLAAKRRRRHKRCPERSDIKPLRRWMNSCSVRPPGKK